MRTPPLKALEAVKTGRVDNRTRRLVSHYREFFRCYDAAGRENPPEADIARIALTQRAEKYYDQHAGPTRLPT